MFRKTKPLIPEAIQEVEAKPVGRCRNMAELKTRRENSKRRSEGKGGSKTQQNLWPLQELVCFHPKPLALGSKEREVEQYDVSRARQGAVIHEQQGATA